MLAGLGGHVLQFRPLAAALLPKWHVTGILYPIYAGSGKSYPTLEGLADDMVGALENIEGPVVFVGYSMGGAVAFDIACRLRKQGRSVVVVMIDTSVPALRRRYGGILRRMRRLLFIWPMKILGIKRNTAPAWQPKEENVQKFVAENRTAVNNFIPEKSDVQIILVRAIPKDKFAWLWGQNWPSRDYGWSAVARVEAIFHCPGNHVTVIEPEYQGGLAKALDQAFEHAFAQLGDPA